MKYSLVAVPHDGNVVVQLHHYYILSIVIIALLILHSI